MSNFTLHSVLKHPKYLGQERLKDRLCSYNFHTRFGQYLIYPLVSKQVIYIGMSSCTPTLENLARNDLIREQIYTWNYGSNKHWK